MLIRQDMVQLLAVVNLYIGMGSNGGDECSDELGDMYDHQKCHSTRHRLGRVVHAPSR